MMPTIFFPMSILESLLNQNDEEYFQTYYRWGHQTVKKHMFSTLAMTNIVDLVLKNQKYFFS